MTSHVDSDCLTARLTLEAVTTNFCSHTTVESLLLKQFPNAWAGPSGRQPLRAEQSWVVGVW